MADFLTTSGTSHHIENIIMESKTKLVLVSPYLKLSKTFFERLKDASGKGVSIKIIYGKDELKPNERNSLAELRNAELFYFQNLHAKCFFNENKMVITSMNMYEFSEKTNREMGILIERTTDKGLFEKAMNETFSILKSSEKIPLNKQERTGYNLNNKAQNIRQEKKKFQGDIVFVANAVLITILTAHFALDVIQPGHSLKTWIIEKCLSRLRRV